MRQELIDAAARLFGERGFDAVTVEEIADAADVAPRTFYRYFPVKEDVVTAELQEGAALLLEALAERPPEEPPLRALEEAMRAPLAQLSKPRLCGALRLMHSSPSVLAHDMAARARTEEAITTELAERMGVDPGSDLRPRIIAACFLASMSVAVRDWAEAGAQDDLNARLRRVMGLLRGGLEGEA